MEMVVFILIVVFGIVGLFLFHDASEKAKSDQVKQQLKQIVELTEPHYQALSVKRRQLVFKDSYGQEVLDKWYRELEYFINTVLRKDRLASDFLGYSEKQILSEQTQRGMKSLLSEFRRGKLGIVRDLLDVHICGFMEPDGTEPADNAVEDLSPVEFELFCCKLLTLAGWDANTTAATGDQGIDIIAYRDGVKAVFQCKKYSQPVGNAAVQEIISGKLFEQAQVAAVVTNTSYTTSAKQLANSLDVKLLHYSELMSFK